MQRANTPVNKQVIRHLAIKAIEANKLHLLDILVTKYSFMAETEWITTSADANNFYYDLIIEKALKIWNEWIKHSVAELLLSHIADEIKQGCI